jgi:hypothetical protein
MAKVESLAILMDPIGSITTTMSAPGWKGMLAAVKTMPAMVAGGVAPLPVLAAKRHVLALQVQTGSRLCTRAHSGTVAAKFVLDSPRYA